MANITKFFLELIDCLNLFRILLLFVEENLLVNFKLILNPFKDGLLFFLKHFVDFSIKLFNVLSIFDCRSFNSFQMRINLLILFLEGRSQIFTFECFFKKQLLLSGRGLLC